ncbi:hypothetical protein ANRL1_04050 [Anaerolineae bacterium]|nr:hypothetical protein ANRL1_04050 [Anaerolineae bacterium]
MPGAEHNARFCPAPAQNKLSLLGKCNRDLNKHEIFDAVLTAEFTPTRPPMLTWIVAQTNSLCNFLIYVLIVFSATQIRSNPFANVCHIGQI